MMKVRKRWIFSGFAVGLLLLTAVAQLGSASGRSAAAAAPSVLSNASPEAEMIRATERARLRALVEADVTVARTLMSDDAQVVNPAGGTLTPEDYLASVASGDIDYLVFEPTSPIVVRLYGHSAAIRYQASFDLVVFGLRLTHAAWITDVYERRQGRWQMVWEQATAIPNDLGLFLDSIKRPG